MTEQSAHSRYGSGKSVRRVEDDSLLTGRDQFADNFSLPGQAYARLRAFAVSACADRRDRCGRGRGMPGVVAVVTGDDLVRAGVKPLLQSSDFRRRDGAPTAAPPQHALAVDVVRYVGEAVAAIVADTREQARDAAEALEVVYEPLPMVVDLADAIAPGAPLVWPRRPAISPASTGTATRKRPRWRWRAAAHVVSLDLVNQRLIPATIEPRATLASYDAATDRITLRVSCQTPDRDSRRNVQRGARHRARQDARAGRRRRRRVRHEDHALRRRHRCGLLRARS